jgi:hypothetical protein
MHEGQQERTDYTQTVEDLKNSVVELAKIISTTNTTLAEKVDSFSDKLNGMGTDLAVTKVKVEDLHKIIKGNGVPGLIQDLNTMRLNVKDLCNEVLGVRQDMDVVKTDQVIQNNKVAKLDKTFLKIVFSLSAVTLAVTAILNWEQLTRIFKG